MGADEAFTVENEKVDITFKYVRLLEIEGFTKDSRQEHLNQKVEKWSKYGWSLIQYHDEGPFDSFAKIGHNEPPTFWDQFLWFEEELFLKFLKIGLNWLALGIIGLVLQFVLPPVGTVLLLIFALAPLALGYHAWTSGTRREAQHKAKEAREAQQLQAQQIATSLQKLLRSNHHINESLVISVTADPYGDVKVTVSNVWLSRPDYEQKQMKQIIEGLLKKIAGPDGWSFYIVDYMGNRIRYFFLPF